MRRVVSRSYNLDGEMAPPDGEWVLVGTHYIPSITSDDGVTMYSSQPGLVAVWQESPPPVSTYDRLHGAVEDLVGDRLGTDDAVDALKALASELVELRQAKTDLETIRRVERAR